MNNSLLNVSYWFSGIVFGNSVYYDFIDIDIDFFMKIFRISINKNSEIIALCSVMYKFRL